MDKRAIAYYILQKYDDVLSDLDKVIQLDPLNSLAYYLKSLTYYTKKDINKAIIASKQYTKLSLNSNDILAKTHLFHLKYLPKKNNSEDLNYDETLTEINQVSNINYYFSLDVKYILN